MRVLLSILFLLQALFANSYVDAYLQGGVEKVERMIEKRLEDAAYWEKTLGDQNVTYGYYQDNAYETIIVCDKSEPILNVYDQNMSKIFSIPAVVGKIKGDKRVEGDLKTPVGVYNFTKKITKLDPFYGPLAYVTNYPNFFDRMHKKNGSGIWLHGYPMDQSEKENTKGCVAIENDNLLSLDKQIHYKKSLFIINERGTLTTNKGEVSAILAFIYRWRNAWKYDRYEQYIGMYDEQFKRFDGKDKKQFARMKKRIFEIASKKQIHFSDIEITPYPNSMHHKIFKVRMDEVYDASNHHFEGKKELYLRMNDDGKITIMMER